MILEHVRLVLVRTFHPGNIGSAARCAKTMALPPLHLVNPKQYPEAQATQMAAGAEDWLNQSIIHDSVASAVKDCRLVIATTARPRGYDLPELTPRPAAELLLEHSATGPVALIFGPERMGLHNEDLQQAQYRLTIPANPEYCSLNLAAAVQIMSYELYQAALAHPPVSQNQLTENQPTEPLPPAEQFEALFARLERVLSESGFLRAHQGETLDRIRHWVRRSELTQAEMNIALGALNAIQRSLPPERSK